MCKIPFLQQRLKFLLAALLFLPWSFNPGSAFARAGFGFEPIENPPQTITGVVKDAGNGRPLSGATISVKGATQSTASDAKGNFSIVSPDNINVLVVSFVGYITQEVPVGSR